MDISTRKDNFKDEVATEINKAEETPTKLIFRTYIAKGLINAGFPVIDIKANRDDPARTVFVFPDSISLRDNMQRIIKSYKRRREDREKQEQENSED